MLGEDNGKTRRKGNADTLRKALSESGRRFRTLVENLNGMVYRCRNDPTWTMEYVSSGAYELTGHRPEHLIGNRMLAFGDLIHPDDREKVWDIIQEALRERRPFTLTYRVRDADGEEKWVWEQGQGVVGPDGTVEALEGFITDITEAVRSRRALEAVESILTASPVVVFLWKNEAGWPVEVVSENVKDIFGYSAEEFISGAVRYTQVIHPDDLERVAHEVERHSRDRGTDGFMQEYRIVSKDGAVRWLDDRTFIRRDAWETITHYQGAVLDITDRKRAEERITHLNRVLHAIRDVTQLIVRESDPETLIQETCDLLVKHRGYDGALIVLTDDFGTPRFFVEAGMGDTFDPLAEEMRRGILPACCEAARVREGVLVVNETRELCRNCPILEICRKSQPICVRLKHGETVYGALAVAVDRKIGVDEEELTLLTEMAGDVAFALHGIEQGKAVKRAEEDRKRMESELWQAQKMEAIGRLAGGIAHDFNNMLNVINGYADLVLSALREEDPHWMEIDQIRKAGDRAAALTRQLLAFSRKQILKPEVVNLNRIVADTEKMLQRLIGEHIRLDFRPAENLGAVKVDPGQIEQVIINLAVNARDAMPMGGCLTIETRNVELDSDYVDRRPGVQPGPYVMLAISDTGMGMEEGVRQRIFEPFFTTKESGKGTGLGLATVYGIVRQSGGHIWVYSEMGKGTTFKIYLPRTQEPACEQGSPRIEGLVGGTETILIVEDDEAVRELTRRILETAGYDVLTAADGEEALRLWERRDASIHMVLTDVIMPGMSGRELAERLKASDPAMKVLYMSGYTDNAIVHHGVLDDGTHFIEKPFTVLELARKVREVLDG